MLCWPKPVLRPLYAAFISEKPLPASQGVSSAPMVAVAQKIKVFLVSPINKTASGKNANLSVISPILGEDEPIAGTCQVLNSQALIAIKIAPTRNKKGVVLNRCLWNLTV